MVKKDYLGQKFGFWTVKEYAGRIKGRHSWLCVCDCGTQKIMASSALSQSNSCGCSRILHGHSRNKNINASAEYDAWCAMRKRCTNKNHRSFKDYGGRGITVDMSWLNFENFIKDMGPRPSKKYSLDRIDNNKGYSKENCRWATHITQSQNKRNNVILIYNEQNIKLIDLAAEWKCKPSYIYNHLRRGKNLDYIEKRIKNEEFTKAYTGAR